MTVGSGQSGDWLGLAPRNQIDNENDLAFTDIADVGELIAVGRKADLADGFQRPEYARNALSATDWCLRLPCTHDRNQGDEPEHFAAHRKIPLAKS